MQIWHFGYLLHSRLPTWPEFQHLTWWWHNCTMFSISHEHKLAAPFYTQHNLFDLIVQENGMFQVHDWCFRSYMDKKECSLIALTPVGSLLVWYRIRWALGWVLACSRNGTGLPERKQEYRSWLTMIYMQKYGVGQEELLLKLDIKPKLKCSAEFFFTCTTSDTKQH